VRVDTIGAVMAVAAASLSANFFRTAIMSSTVTSVAVTAAGYGLAIAGASGLGGFVSETEVVSSAGVSVVGTAALGSESLREKRPRGEMRGDLVTESSGIFSRLITFTMAIA